MTQQEVSKIISQILIGCKDYWQLGIIHRDVKLANILLHFPDNPEIGSMSKADKEQFLRSFDLLEGNFKAIISDFGLSTQIESGSEHILTICGTPLYSSPELLKKLGYSYKVDIWAIGIMCYELLMGRTPFHAWKLDDLIAKINRGDYPVIVKDELTVECALFLTQCLQSDEANRIAADELINHPFLTFIDNETYIDREEYINALTAKSG